RDRGGGAFPGQPGLFIRHGTMLRCQRGAGHVLMLPRRTALLGLILAAAVWAADPQLDFVQLSDIHIAKFCTAHPRFAKDFEPKKDAVAHFKAALDTVRRDVAPAFLLITGDLSDAYGFEGAGGEMVYGQFEVFKSFFDGCPIPIYPALGNHDITQY